MTVVTWLMTIYTMVPQMKDTNITILVAMTMLGMFLTQLIFMVLGLPVHQFIELKLQHYAVLLC